MTTDITFSGGWFSKGKYEVEDNELIWWRKKLKWKWLIIPTFVKEYYSIPIDEVAYFVPHRTPFKNLLSRLFGKKSQLLVGTKKLNEDYVLTIPDKNIGEMYKIFADHSSPAMAVIDNVISEKKETAKSIKKFKTVKHPNTLWIYPEMIIGVTKKYSSYEISRVVCSEARFFTSKRIWREWIYCPIIKLPKQVTYFGFLEQISIALSNRDAETVKNHLTANGAPFAKKQSETIGSCTTPDLLWKPKLWFVRERIALTDDALIYHRRGLYGTEMVYVPFSDMAFVLSKPFLKVLPAKIYMLGQQNVLTYKCFLPSHLDRLRKELDKNIKNVTDSGIIGRQCWLEKLCTLKFTKDIIAVSKDGVAIVGRTEGGKKGFGYSPMDGLSSWVFVRKHWYSLVSALYVSGDYGNIRKDQVSGFSAYITGLWICKRRAIKALLKAECPKGYVDDKDARKEIKEWIFEDSKSFVGKAVGSMGKNFISSMLKS